MGGGRISGAAKKPAHPDKKPDKKNNPEDVFSQTSPRLHGEHSGHVRTACQYQRIPRIPLGSYPSAGFSGSFFKSGPVCPPGPFLIWPIRKEPSNVPDPGQKRHRSRTGRQRERQGRTCRTLRHAKPPLKIPSPPRLMSPLVLVFHPPTTEMPERFRGVTAFTDFPSPLEENGSQGGSDNGQNPSRIQGICDKNCDQGNDGNRNGASQG